MRPAPVVMNVEQRGVVPYRRTPWYRRLAALIGLGASGVLMGAVVAIFVAASIIGVFYLVNALLR